ncbi:KleE stable inheritance protein [Thiolapillus sp.]|uniref:KleE stable inheritance protein n=2 Tax=Thiolapillus sp. TaxID=2017437 RepID=UPI003AF78F2A
MRTTGKQCGLAATGVYQPSLRSPWLAAMDNVIKFPCHEPEPVEVTATMPPGRVARVWNGIAQFVWIVLMLLWPVMRVVAVTDVTFQFFRMIYHWNTPDVYAGWTFLLHFAVLTVLTYVMANWKPKGMKK